MLLKNSKKFGLLIAIFFVIQASLHAQESSPFSSFGIGETVQPTFLANNAMGGIATGYRSPLNINYTNPASYTALRRTVFETGFFYNYRSTQDAANSHTTHNASLSHLALGFPVSKWWGASIGLIPYSRVGYQVKSSYNSDIPGFEEVQYRARGKGGLNRFYFGNGFRYKKVSAGFNFDYLFGSVNSVLFDSLPADDNFFNNRRTEHLVLNGVSFNGGIQFDTRIIRGKKDTVGKRMNDDKKDLAFTFGLNQGLGSNMKGRTFNTWERITYTGIIINVKDTIVDDTVSVTAKLPAYMGAGFTLRNTGKWLIGADFTYTPWSQFVNYKNSDLLTSNWEMADSWKLSLGGNITPNPTDENMLNRIEYRMGVYYESTRMKINQNTVSDYGMTFGIGIPLRRSESRVNLALQVGQRGSVTQNALQETYFNAYLGFTLADRWFIKRRFF